MLYYYLTLLLCTVVCIAVRAFAQMRQDVASSGTPELSLDEINAIINETRDAR